MKKGVLTIAATFLLTPVLALAQFGEISGFFDNAITFINSTLIPLVFALALLAFLWGALKYFIWGGDNEDNRKEGTKLMLYSVLGFVLMVSIFGIVQLVISALGIDQQESLENIPDVPMQD